MARSSCVARWSRGGRAAVPLRRRRPAAGGALAAGARRSGFAIAFAAALTVSFFYYGVLQVGQVLGRQGVLVPWLAAWLSNFLFLGVGAWLLARAPK